MSNANQTQPLAEQIQAIFQQLTQGAGKGANDAQWQIATELAHEQAPHDHWLQTGSLDYETRLFLSAAAALSMHCLKGSPYKCAVLTRGLAESLA